MSTVSHQSAEDKQLQFVVVATGAGLVWGVLRGIISAFQGKSQHEISTEVAKSVTSVTVGTYLGQVTADQAQEAGYDRQSSRFAGLAVGTATKFGTRALFDAAAPESTKKG